MKYYDLELTNYEEKDNEIVENGKKIYRLRLSSSNAINLEKVCNKSVIDIMSDVSVTNIVRILEYMGKDSEHNFGHKEASSLYDQLIMNGYTMEQIVTDIIYEVMVLAGFLTKEELVEMKETKEAIQESTHKKIQSIL